MKMTSNRVIIDLVMTRSGIRKTITEYIAKRFFCPKCMNYRVSPVVSKLGRSALYGHRFKAFLVYQRVALRMTYPNIAELLKEQFHEIIPTSSYGTFIRDVSRYYAETSTIITKSLLESPVIHADETPVNIRGGTQYVWVFTDNKYVIFRLTKTREATIAHEVLGNYQGVLVSDFYAGYDSIPCRQQKCWAHLIRDLNADGCIPKV